MKRHPGNSVELPLKMKRRGCFVKRLNCTGKNQDKEQEKKSMETDAHKFEVACFLSASKKAKIKLSSSEKSVLKFYDGKMTTFEAAIHNCPTILLAIHLHNPEAISRREKGEMTLAHQAAQSGSVEVLQVLYNKCGAAEQMRATDDSGRTPAHSAAGCGNIEVLRLLGNELGAGETFTTLDKYARTPAIYTLTYGYSRASTVAVLRCLKDEFGVASTFKAQDYFGKTIAHRAAERNKVDVLRFLYNECGEASMFFTTDNMGQTPAHAAVINGHAGLLRIMFNEFGASELINISDNYGRTLAHDAAKAGSVEILRLLHDEFGAAATLTAADNRLNSTPLHIAAKIGHVDVLRVLHGYFGKSALRKRDVRERTPAHIAALAGNIDFLRDLVHLGSPILLTAKAKRTSSERLTPIQMLDNEDDKIEMRRLLRLYYVRRKLHAAILAVWFTKHLWNKLEERTQDQMEADWLDAQEQHVLSADFKGIFMMGWEARNGSRNRVCGKRRRDD